MKENKLIYNISTKQEAIIEVELTIEETEQRLKFSLDGKKQLLREQREQECFTYINRGPLWYKTLTEPQLQELEEWYQAWLDVTSTLEIPNKPEWIK